MNNYENYENYENNERTRKLNTLHKFRLHQSEFDDSSDMPVHPKTYTSQSKQGYTRRNKRLPR